MATTAIVIVSLAIAIAFLLYIRHFQASRRSLPQIEARLSPVDAGALGNLFAEREDDFLRRNLGPKEYRTIKRERVLAALGYVTRISRNAYWLSRIAGLALDSPDPKVHETALKLARDAVQLRQYA